MDANDAIVYLCKCVIKGQIPDRYITTSLNMDDLYKAASHHMLAAMVGMAIKSAGIKNKTDPYKGRLRLFCKLQGHAIRI